MIERPWSFRFHSSKQSHYLFRGSLDKGNADAPRLCYQFRTAVSYQWRKWRGRHLVIHCSKAGMRCKIAAKIYSRVHASEWEALRSSKQEEWSLLCKSLRSIDKIGWLRCNFRRREGKLLERIVTTNRQPSAVNMEYRPLRRQHE